MFDRKAIYWNLVFIAAYVLVGKFGFLFSTVNHNVSLIWPPTGIAIAIILLYGNRFLPGVFLGSLIVHLLTHGLFFPSLFIALINTFEAFAIAYTVNVYAGGRYAFDKVKHAMTFVVFAALVCALTAVVGVACLVLGGAGHFSYALWQTWWLGDMGSTFLLTPLIIVWVSSRRHIIDHFQIPELLSVTFFFALTELVIFNSQVALLPANYAVVFIIIFPLLWLALRFKRRIVTLALFFMAVLMISATLHGIGPFAGVSLNDSLLALQTFMVAIIVTVLLIISLVAERAQAFKAIAARERHYHALIEKSAGGIILLNENGHITYVSSTAERLTGYAAHELLGRSGRKFFYPLEADTSTTDSAIENVSDIITVAFPSKAEVSFKRRDGGLIWLESMSTDLLADPDINAVVVNFHDITERKQAQEKKNQFLSLVSQQLHTPLETIRKYASVMLDNKKQFSILDQTYIHEIDKSSTEMTKHVENLIKLSRIESGILDIQPRSTKLRKEVEEALQKVTPKLTAKRIKLDRHFTLQGAVVLIDSFIFTSLVVTFLIDVISRIPQNGTLSVETLERNGSPAIKIFSSTSSPIVPADHMAVQTHELPDNKNTGAGTDILVAKALAAYMGMEILEENAPGKESLTIILDRTAQAAAVPLARD